MVPARSPSIGVGRDDERALGQRLQAGLGADGHLEPAVEHVAQQGDDDVLLLEDAEHLAHGVDRVERLGHASGAADEDAVGVGVPGPSQRLERATVATTSIAAVAACAGSAGARGDERLTDQVGGEVGGGRGQRLVAEVLAGARRCAWRRRRWTARRPPARCAARARRAAPSGRWRPRAAGPITTAVYDVRSESRAGRVVEHLLEGAVGLGEEGADLLALGGRQSGRARRACRRRTGSPSRSGCDPRWCGAGGGSPPARERPCRCARSPTRR